MAIYLAYVGSIGGDWVSHYAVRMAAHDATRTLHVVYVRDGQFNDTELAQKLELIAADGRRASVTCTLAIHELQGTVNQTLRVVVPGGADTFLLCAARHRSGLRGLLAGTVSERMLRGGHCRVLALRVAHPGLLGLPRRLLLPVAGHPRGFGSGMPYLKLFGPDVSDLHILFVQQVARWRFRMLSATTAEQLRQPGEEYCRRIEREIAEQLELAPTQMHASTIVSDDVPKEIVIAANRTNTRLILMGASERSLAERFCSASAEMRRSAN